ncbi:MAG: hypothetical protein ACSHW0_04630 [Thalassotalea sp.]
MATLIGFVLLFIPLVAMDYYSHKEFDLSLSDNLKKWRVAKYTAILIVFLYCIHLLINGHEYVIMDEHQNTTYLEDWFRCLAGIVYSKPAGYCLSESSSPYGTDMKEDYAFIIGWLGLLYFTWVVFLESL